MMDAFAMQSVNSSSEKIQGFAQMMTQPEQTVIHVNQQQTLSDQQQQFIRQFQYVIQRHAALTAQAGTGETTLSIKLHPEHLGRLDIQIVRIEGALIARILTGSQASRELIESQLSHLRHAFLQQQLNVERIEVAEQPFFEQKQQSASDEKKASAANERE